MTECNRKKQLLGKSIRKIRVRRNMTMRLHAGSVNVESSEDGAAHYLETAKHLNEYLNDHGTGR